MSFSIASFEDFAAHLLIPSRDLGITPMTPLFGTQRHVLQQIAAGMAEGVREFVILKGGRQIGGTTLCDALMLYWLQSNPGMVGMFVADDDDNRDFRRDLHIQMLESLPPSYRFPTRMNNRAQLAWDPPNNSRLIYAAAGKRTGSNLGRSRGVNFGINDEVASWPDQQAIIALHAAYSKKHPARLFISVSTARGFGPFKTMVEIAQKAVAQRFIWVAWYHHDGYRIERTEKRLWARYGSAPITAEEHQWMRIVKKRYGLSIAREQVAWLRWTLAEECQGDQAMLSQEYGCLPEECFQAFGDRFIAAPLLQRLRLDVTAAPRPKGYRYEWGDTLDATNAVPCDPADAPLLVWEEPEPDGVYVVAGHPAFSSGQDAPNFCAQVWRVWPDRAVQVAEYHATDGSLYTFAWVLIHMCAAYSMAMRAYLIHEVGYTGQQVLGELQRIERYSYGISPHARKTPKIENMIGNIRHYFFYRIDTLRQNPAYHVKMTESLRPFLLNALRDEIERRHLTLRSAPLLDELAMLRRGEHGDSDQIGGGGGAAVERVITAAYAVECWLKAALPDLESVLAPAVPPERPERRVEEMLVQGFFARLGGGG